MKVQTIKVQLPGRNYQALVGTDVIQSLARFAKSKKFQNVFVIADVRLMEARQKTIETLRKANLHVQEIPVAAGEGFKDISAIYNIYGELIKLGAKRNALIVALGGGTVGDAAGFIAATYLRGVAWAGVPTTLLAQVDSSLGGKTGINHELGKNMIGAFHQPQIVVCELDFLKTLSQREIVSGLGEALKYGLVFDPKFFGFFEKSWQAASQYDFKALQKIVSESLKFKAKVVSRDERDLKGLREVLNFGHTLGHALESQTNFEYFHHGEAVIWGMRFAVNLSHIISKLNPQIKERVNSLLWEIPVPALPQVSLEEIMKDMQKDKKVLNSKFKFVLLKNLGKAYSSEKVGAPEIRQAYEEMVNKI